MQKNNQNNSSSVS